jgi:phosphate transport system protein
MSRDTFYRQVDQIQQEILLLESMVEQAVLKSVQNLKSRNLNEARQLYDDDVLLNEKRFAIENAVLILIATQQPMARDLRKLAAILEISGELERMGDYAKGISKVVLILQDTELSIPLTDIERMAKISVDMLHRAITAFVAEDIKTASQIPEGDNEVDELYNHFYRLLMDAMIANPKIIDDANHLMWVAHNLERLADRVTNICERTVFIATGELLEFDRTDDEDA